MSEMSQAQGPPGGDPLDLVGAVGTEDDVLPGPTGGVEVGEESGEDVASAEFGSATDADPGVGNSASGSDPMPDLTGTTD